MANKFVRPRLRRSVRWLSIRAHIVAVVWAVVVEAGLKARPLPALAVRLGTPLGTPDAERPPPPEASAESFTAREWIRLRAIDRVMKRWPFGDTCLRRSLLWGHTLRTRSPKLRIGVARDEGGAIIAHSWIELGDELSLGLDPDVAYQPLGRTTKT